MNTPQMLAIGWMAFAIYRHLTKHGEPNKLDTYNVYIILTRTILWGALLVWGGFFDGVKSCTP